MIDEIEKIYKSKKEHVDNINAVIGDNMDLETIIRQNSYYYCDKCEYKSKY